MSTRGALGIAKVLAHCGGSPAGAMRYLAHAIAADPFDPQPYAALEDLRDELPTGVAAVLATADTVRRCWPAPTCPSPAGGCCRVPCTLDGLEG